MPGVPTHRDHVWSYDFAADRTSDGQLIRMLTIMDEFTRECLGRVGVKTLFIEPGSPWENGYVASFNGKLRDELLEREAFDTLLEAKVLIERWRQHYNTIRPHSALGYRPCMANNSAGTKLGAASMADRVSDNLAMLMRVVDRLSPLRNRLVFLGGAVTELFITQPGGPGPRQTKDVDVVIDVVNLGEYSETLREQLVALGLQEDIREGAPVCRWLLDDIIVDIMPTRGEILGFSAEWYPLAYETATPISLPNGTVVRLVTPACFLATKLAAFGDRGRRNPIASHDLEDMIAVIDGRVEITRDVAAAT